MSNPLEVFIITKKSIGVMDQWLERLPYIREVVASSHGRVKQKTFKIVLTAFSSGARCMRMEWGS